MKYEYFVKNIPSIYNDSSVTTSIELIDLEEAYSFMHFSFKNVIDLFCYLKEGNEIKFSIKNVYLGDSRYSSEIKNAKDYVKNLDPPRELLIKKREYSEKHRGKLFEYSSYVSYYCDYSFLVPQSYSTEIYNEFGKRFLNHSDLLKEIGKKIWIHPDLNTDVVTFLLIEIRKSNIKSGIGKYSTDGEYEYRWSSDNQHLSFSSLGMKNINDEYERFVFAKVLADMIVAQMRSARFHRVIIESVYHADEGYFSRICLWYSAAEETLNSW